MLIFHGATYAHVRVAPAPVARQAFAQPVYALGYEYEEVKEKFEGNVMTERTVTKKEVVPDTTAQIFWLKNRKPKLKPKK